MFVNISRWHTLVSQDSSLFLVFFVFWMGSVILDESLEHIGGFVHKDGVAFKDGGIGVQFIVVTVLFAFGTDLDSSFDSPSAPLDRELNFSIMSEFQWFV